MKELRIRIGTGDNITQLQIEVSDEEAAKAMYDIKKHDSAFIEIAGHLIRISEIAAVGVHQAKQENGDCNQ